jgi:RNA polymerase sigma-70 factor (ECF subfamily)
LSETSSLEAAAADLVTRARRGDADALSQLLQRCRGTIYQWALIQTGEAADAEDVAQEVLIRLHTSLGRYAGRSRFTTWLYQVTRNEALNLRRRLRSRLRLADVVTQEAAVDATAPNDPVERVHAARVAELAAQLLHRLPRRQREVFHLADLQGCAPAEIAERLGMDPVTARVHLFHARRAIRAGILKRWPELAEEAKP